MCHLEPLRGCGETRIVARPLTPSPKSPASFTSASPISWKTPPEPACTCGSRVVLLCGGLGGGDRLGQNTNCIIPPLPYTTCKNLKCLHLACALLLRGIGGFFPISI